MPTYQYRCTDCGTELEVVQKFTDDALTVCPECEGRLRKVFNAVGVVFKGSGFYATDNRPKSKSTSSSASETRKSEKSESKHKADHKQEHKKSEHKKAEHKSDHSTTSSSSTGSTSTS